MKINTRYVYFWGRIWRIPRVVWFAVLIVCAASLRGYGQTELPENPKVASGTTLQAPRPVQFWTYRKSWQDPPLRTNRQTFKSKVLWIGAGVHLAALSVACARWKTSGEHWDSELPAFFGVQALNYASMRYFAAWYVPPVDAYAVQHYIRAAAQ